LIYNYFLIKKAGLAASAWVLFYGRPSDGRNGIEFDNEDGIFRILWEIGDFATIRCHEALP
jgi:hypothetical protein